MPEPYFVDWPSVPRRALFPGVRAAIASGERLMLSRVEIDPHGVVPEHHHFHEQFGVVLQGEATFTVGGETRLLRAGDSYAIPGDVPHAVVAGPQGAVCLDVF